MVSDTVSSLALQLNDHLRECGEQNKRVDRKLDELSAGHADILKTLAGLNRSAWQALGAVMLVVLTGVMAIIVAMVSRQPVQTVVAAPTAETREILSEIRAMRAAKP